MITDLSTTQNYRAAHIKQVDALIDKQKYTMNEPLSIDEIIERALAVCSGLPHACDTYINQIRDLKSRLSRGRLHLAILGQFNRGKSTFINALIGLKILPTSVLPLTSVPTIISYNRNVTCTVRFLDKKPDLIVTHSIESIQSTLKKYVAEENNPKNELCVKEVEVTCPSQLLENGTVLIDTPGFGSTHIHNTNVALGTLAECDAAVFLLSADPPLTQTELEFLKQVNRFVPRIFFVLNKVDLLASEDLASVDRFITGVLVTQMKYPVEMKLFHICASKGEKAAGAFDSQYWIDSNMGVVKTQILDFMLREKYFTLSQALNEKFHEAVNGIESCLNEEIRDFTIPVEVLSREQKEMQEQSGKLKKAMEREVALTAVEESAVIKYVDEQIDSEAGPLRDSLSKYCENMLQKSQAKSSSIQPLSVAFTDILMEKLEKIFIKEVNSCNKPLRKAIQIHSQEYNRLAEEVQKTLGAEMNEKNTIREQLDKCELPALKWQVEGSIDLTITTGWMDNFKSQELRIDRYKKNIDVRLSEIIPFQLVAIKRTLKEQINNSFKKMHEILESQYRKLSDLLDVFTNKKGTAINERQNDGGTRMEFLKKSVESFEQIRKMMP